MATGYEHYEMLDRLERNAERLGFEVGRSRFGNSISLRAIREDLTKNSGLSRDFDVATGSAEELLSFLDGWEKARWYLKNLRVVTDEKIKKAEEQILEDRTAEVLKNGTKSDK